jgi:hypothetical protein
MLTTDLNPVGNKTWRGQELLNGWQNAALNALEESIPVDDGKLRESASNSAAFGSKLVASNAGFGAGAGPVLLFTATDVKAGERFVFSNTARYSKAFSPNVPIGVAVLHSARFPVISPPGVISEAGQQRWLVDGGVFDNSGAATLLDFLVDARASHQLPGGITVVRINGNALERDEDNRCANFYKEVRKKGWDVSLRDGNWLPKEKTSKPGQTYFGWSSGVNAYVATRSAHTEEAARSLNHEWMPDIVNDTAIPQLRLDYLPGFDGKCAATLPERAASDLALSPDATPGCLATNEFICGMASPPRAPLGWYLSQWSANTIQLSAGTAALDILKATQQYSDAKDQH